MSHVVALPTGLVAGAGGRGDSTLDVVLYVLNAFRFLQSVL